MDELHSLLVLVDTALSAAEPRSLTSDPGSLEGLRKRLSGLKQKAARYRGVVDYHSLECESYASFLGNKIEHLFLSPDGGA